jgi:hypothetical protein
VFPIVDWGVAKAGGQHLAETHHPIPLSKRSLAITIF